MPQKSFCRMHRISDNTHIRGSRREDIRIILYDIIIKTRRYLWKSCVCGFIFIFKNIIYVIIRYTRHNDIYTSDYIIICSCIEGDRGEGCEYAVITRSI